MAASEALLWRWRALSGWSCKLGFVCEDSGAMCSACIHGTSANFGFQNGAAHPHYSGLWMITCLRGWYHASMDEWSFVTSFDNPFHHLSATKPNNHLVHDRSFIQVSSKGRAFPMTPLCSFIHTKNIFGSICRTQTMHRVLCFKSKFPNHFAFTLLRRYLFLFIFCPMWMLIIVL